MNKIKAQTAKAGYIPRGVTILCHYLHPFITSYTQIDLTIKQKVIKSIVPYVHRRFDNDWTTQSYPDCVRFEPAHIPLAAHIIHMCLLNIQTYQVWIVSFKSHPEHRIPRQTGTQAW